MRRQILATLMVFTGAAALGAQQPGPGRGGPGPIPEPRGMGFGGMMSGPADNPAQFLLAQTGELKLTDAQVTRLAAIARRTTARRQALRAQLDSLRPERLAAPARDSAGRAQMRQRMEQMRPALERFREQTQADRRDAIAVLTPDQQAQAWERVANGRRGMRPGFAGARARQGMQRGAMTPRRGMGPGARRMGPPNDSASPGAREFRRPGPGARPEGQN